MSAFEELVGDIDYPMYVVTVAADGERSGCLIGFATQASIDPPRFLVCLSLANHTYRVAQGAAHLGVHLVPADRGDVAEVFGSETGDEVDKFDRVEWHDGPEGVPLLDACPSWFVGRVRDRLPGGDHEAFLLDPVAGEHDPAGPPLTFQRAKDLEPGHEA
jgi:flavin reductase (DIM6/NTAB) family NADH-FMN oxidoreductase RutF